MERLMAEAARARRLAETAHDSRLARELKAYAVELEGHAARCQREQTMRQRLGF